MTETPQANPGGRLNLWRPLLWLTIAGLLLTPAVAMRFTDDVSWTPGDFVFAGVVLIGAGVVFELAAWRSGRWTYRLGAALGLLASVLLVWITGAVGIIGSEAEAANLMYGGVLIIGLVGAVVARFRPGGLAIAMALAALAQVVIAVIAIGGGLGASSPAWPWDILGVTGMFTVLWLGSAALFRQAAR